MKIALVFGMRLFKGRPLREMLDVARVADDLGFGYLTLAEHVLMYKAGAERHPPDELMPEPLTTLAAFAGATQRIGLMTGILIAPLRPPELLARTVATLNAISNGRLALGVSTSWQAQEYAALGVPFTDRGRVLEQVVRVCKQVNPTVPVWFGGKFTPRLIRRVVTLGDGWIPFQGYNESLEEIADKTRQLKEAMRSAGRDPGSLQVAYWARTFGRDIADVLAELPAIAAAGVTVTQVLFTTWCQTSADAPKVLEEIAVRLSAARLPAPT